MKLLICLTLMSLLAATPMYGQAQEGQGKKYSLDDCLATALKNNTDIMRSENDIERTRSSKRQSLGQFLPDLSANATWSRSDKDNIGLRGNALVISRNSYSYNVRSTLTLFDGMNNIATVDRSILNQQSAQETYARKKQDIAYSVYQKYYNVLRNRQLIASSQSNFERSQKQLARIRELFAVGSVPNADVFRQQVQTGQDELLLMQAQNDYSNAVVDLQAYLGINPAMEFAVEDKAIEVMAEEMARFRESIGDFSSLLRMALERRSDFRAASLSREGTKKSVTSARAGYYPSLSAFAQYNWGNIELRDFSTYGRFSYGLSLSVPVFAGFQTRTAVELAELDYLDNDNTMKQLERTIGASIRIALNALNNAEKNVEIATRTLASAREDQRIASEKYAVGAGTLLDLIVATSGFTTAEADLINAKYNYLTARKQLDYQLGNI